MSNKIRKIKKNASRKEFVHFPDALLWEVSKEVDNFGTNGFQELARKLRIACSTERGLAVAAPQVGVLRRAFYYSHPDIGEGVISNPKILAFGPDLVSMQEGCLSIRGYYWDVERPSTVVLGYQDAEGEYKIEHLAGLSARMVQHEIDHLDGKLLVDFLNDDDYDKFENDYFVENKHATYGPLIITGD